MTIDIIQLDETPDSTASRLLIDGEFVCFVLEDGYREVKVPSETRIPAGSYPLRQRFYGGFYEKYKKRYGHAYSLEIISIRNFSDVLIHIGNWIRDTRGCLLVGMDLSLSRRDYCLKRSKVAYLKLYDIIAPAFARGDEITVNVIRSKRPI